MCLFDGHSNTGFPETSLVVQWLRLRLPMQRLWVRSQVGELKSHMPRSRKSKTSNISNIVTNSINTLKIIYIYTYTHTHTHTHTYTDRQDFHECTDLKSEDYLKLGLLMEKMIYLRERQMWTANYKFHLSMVMLPKYCRSRIISQIYIPAQERTF